MRCKDILTVVVAFRPRLVNWPWTVGRLKTIAKSIVVAYEKWIPFKAWLLWLTLRLAWLPEIWYRSIRMPRLSFLLPFALTRPHCHTRQSPHPLTTIFIGEFWYANVFRNAIWNKSLSQKKKYFFRGPNLPAFSDLFDLVDESGTRTPLGSLEVSNFCSIFGSAS